MGKKQKIQVILLAAGKGTRMKSDLPKVLHTISGLPLVSHSINSFCQFASDQDVDLEVGLVVGHGKELVMDHVNEAHKNINIKYAVQEEQNGTGHALQCFLNQHPEALKSDFIFISCGDMPGILPESIQTLFLQSQNFDGTVISFKTPTPKGYGRIVQKEIGFQIVEEKDALEDEKLINEVNSGFYLVKPEFLEKNIKNINNQNNSNEFYLTDIFSKKEKTQSFIFENSWELMGINNLYELSFLEQKIQQSINKSFMMNGVKLIHPERIIIEVGATIKEGTVIYPDVHIDKNSVVEKNCLIENGSIIKNSKIGKNVHLKPYTCLEDSIVQEEAVVGPFARLRPGADIGKKSKIGNFVEVKKAKLEEGVKVSHLSYVGDAHVGKNSNLSCGFITCNYDGANKFKTEIGEDSFIGSACQLIAPIKIGSKAYIAAGSTINNDLEDGDFAIARQRQVTKSNMAKRFLKTGKKE